MTVSIKRLTGADRAAWAAMRTALYTEADPQARADDLAGEIDELLARDDWAAFGAGAPGGQLVGLIELSERNYAEGCLTSPVTYVEGLWVAEKWRRRGIARRLVGAGMEWGRSRDRSEIASDAQLANTISQEAHRRMGFAETERIVCFRMAMIDGR